MSPRSAHIAGSRFFFNEHVFELEQHEYRIEGIDLANITYADNKPLLEMHLKSDKKNPSFFNILDEVRRCSAALLALVSLSVSF